MVSGRQGVVVPQSQFSNLTSTLDFHCMVLSCAFRSCSLRKSLNTSFSPKLRGFWEHLLQYGSLVGLFSIGLQFSSVVQSCPTLCDPMNHSTPSLPVHHQLPEFTQTHFHRVHDAIQPSHSLSSPSPPAPNHSQRQRLFQ